MDVFLIPVGPDRYKLYCEAPEAPAGAPDGRRTIWTRAAAIFGRAVAEGEADDGASVPPGPPRSWLRRVTTRRLAEAVAEQRLLWLLRKETAAGLVHPDTIGGERAIDIARAQLQHDFSRHLRWCVVDSIVAILSIPVSIIPGPNLIGYYFLFRAVGHLYSLRGARHGLRGVLWRCRPTPHLTELGGLLAGDPHARMPRLMSIAGALGLARLPAFVTKIATRRPA